MRNYWWPGVTKGIGKYMDGCDLCQKMIVDIITSLPLVAGKDAILVVCDRLSKITYFVVITEGTLVEELARLF